MQFTAESLARVLDNVETEVLIEAVEKAQKTHLLTNPTIETIAELAGWINLIENMLILGPSALEMTLQEVVESMPKSESTAATLNGISLILDLFRFMPGISQLDDKLEEIVQHLSGASVVAELRDTHYDIVREVQGILVRGRNVIAELQTYFPSQSLDETNLIDALEAHLADIGVAIARPL